MVNTYKLKLTNLQRNILRLLFIKCGEKLNQRRISLFLKVSQPAVMKALPELQKYDLINLHQDKDSRRWEISLNRNNPFTLQLKRIDNLKQIYEQGLTNFLENSFPGSTIVLFGSYSKGEDVQNSDIDIAVIGRKSKNIKLTEFEKSLERPINVNFYGSWSEIHIKLKENICNGIILIGMVEL